MTLFWEMYQQQQIADNSSETLKAASSVRQAVDRVSQLEQKVDTLALGCIKRGIAGSNWCLRVKAFLFHCGSLLLAPQELNRCRHWKRSIQVRLTN